MLTSNQESVMINHIVERRKKHLAKLEKDNAGYELIETWTKFYSRLLKKYSYHEVNNYV